MTPDEFRNQLDDLGLSQVGLARVLEINERTVRSYASGRLEVTPLVSWALKGIRAEIDRRRPR